MASRIIPGIDLELLRDYKSEVLANIRHALINHGCFYLKGYDDMLDQNVIELLFEQSEKVFNLNDTEKSQISIDNSKHFLGHNTEMGTTADFKIWQAIELCSTNEALGSSNYDNIFGPNQFPPGEKDKLFRKSTDQFFDSMNQFSYIVIKLVLEALSIDSKIASSQFDVKDNKLVQSRLKVSHKPRISQKDCTLRHQYFENRKDYSFLDFSFQEIPLQIENIYGTWTDVPPRKNTIVVSAGLFLEHLTQGVVIANNYNVVFPTGPVSRISFTPIMKLDTILKPYEISNELQFEKHQRDKLAAAVISASDLQNNDVVGNKILHHKLKKHRAIAAKWYPEELVKLDQLQKHASKEEKKTRSTDLVQIVERLIKIFIAWDKTMPLVIRNRTSDAKLSEIIPQIKNSIGSIVTESDLMKISYLYLDAAPLILDEYDEVRVNMDKAKDTFSYKNLPTRAEIFRSRALKWRKENPLQSDVPELPRSQIEAPSEAPNKKRLKRDIIQNSKEKFINIGKSPIKEQSTQGMSLLERIRMKERLDSENKITPEQRYQHFLDGKLKSVLEILFALRPDTPYPLEKLSELIKNSLVKSPVSEGEAKDIAIHLTRKFPDTFKSVDIKDSKILKWCELDREELLGKLGT